MRARRLHLVVQATPEWRRLMERLHDDAGLDVWDDRIIQAVLGHLSETIDMVVEDLRECSHRRATLLSQAGHGKAPATLAMATGAQA